MKFVHYMDGDQRCVGTIGPGEESVQRVARSAGGPPFSDLLDVLRVWEADGRRGFGVDARPVPLDSVRLLAPIPRPTRNIFCVGKNYREHADEFARSGFDQSEGSSGQGASHPIFFTKLPSTVIGPGDTIDSHPGITSALDYEAELAVIIGRPGRGIPMDEVPSHIWGYTLINDVTARDLQHQHKQWFLGKSLDGFCPMGPWAVTADEFEERHIQLECRVNGEVRQSASTRDLVFDIPYLIATLSAGITLEVGDIIATGTPAGVGIGFSPPKFLEPGDLVSVTATGLGTLQNKVGPAEASTMKPTRPAHESAH